MKNRLITSLLLYFMFFSGIVLIISGYYFLHVNETEVYRDVLEKSKVYLIKTYDGKTFNTRDLKFYKIDGVIYIRFDGKTVPVSQISLINGIDINTEAVRRMSKNAIAGIILTASGGLIFILSVVLKDYI